MNEAGTKLDRHEFYITPEGSEAALGLLLEKVQNDPDLEFINPLKEKYPEAKVYLVGGIVRDSIMGRSSKDYDFIICGVPLEELQNFMLGQGKIVATSDLQTAVFKFVPEGSKTDLDIAVPRIEQYNGPSRKPDVITEDVTLEDDLSRRDLTINAMAMRVDNGSGEPADPFGGVEDINNHLIRCVGNAAERFSEDPLRILRALRFACRYGYRIAPETWQAILDCKDQLGEDYEDEDGRSKKRVSIERVQKELNGALKGNPELFLELYNESGLLETYMPEVTAMQGVEQPPQFHSEGDVFEHTKLVLNNLPPDAAPELKMAALLHDIGKVNTFQSAEETGDRIRFNRHDEVSAEMAEEILTRLKFENDFVRKVKWLVGNHMKMLTAFAEMKVVKQKKMIRGELNTPEAIDDNIALFDSLVSLAIADASSSLKENGEPDMGEIVKLKEAARVAREAVIVDLTEEAEIIKSGKKPQKIIEGSLVNRLLWEALPQAEYKRYAYLIGEILDHIETAHANGEITSTSEAEDYAKSAIARAKIKIESGN